MVSKGLALTVEGAENETNDIPTFSLNELNRCRGQFLGGGAFGKVYAIEGFSSLAVKEIYLSGQPDRLKEVTKFELGALSRFSHPGVLKYHQVIEDGDFFYVVMDRYSSDLDKFIAKYRKTHEPIPRELLLSIVRQLADALAYIHAPYKVNERGDVLPGIVHRDLKPANVLISEDDNKVVIADFGLCKDAQHDGSTFAGSPAYMAPEAFIHSKTSRASDIWAFGVIIYELVTLELPSFSHHCNLDDAKEFFVPKWKPDLSAVEDDFIRGILERIFVLDPIERPTAGDIAILFQTLSTSANKPRAQNSLLDEKHGPHTASDDNNSKARSSWTPLMSAAAAGDIKAVKKHLSKEGKKDNRKDIALVLAARVGHKDIVELLDPTDKDGVTALMRAAMRGDVEAVGALIHLQKGIIAKRVNANEWWIYGGTALMMATACGNTEVVRLLVEHEGGMRDSEGWTALMHAAEDGHTECVKLLVEKEGGMRKNNGETALIFAAERDHPECVKLLMERECGASGWTELICAAYRGDVNAVRNNIHMKGARDVRGWTALMYATKQRHTEIVELLKSTKDI